MAIKNQPVSVGTCRAFSSILVTLLLVSQLSNGKNSLVIADPASETGKLLSRLDLNRPGLEKVKVLSSDSVQAVKELLNYYRARHSVKHPVDRSIKASMLGNSTNQGDITAAENALKHIFVGQGAYPPYFCGEDINWGLRPVPDNEWVWQLNRMGFWQSMSLAYWHTGDEKYAKEWCFQLLDWTRKNPHDKAHDFAWRSIEAGIRGYGWTTLFQRFLDSPSFTPAVLAAFLNSCYDHASFLMTRYSKGSNWALMEAEGMAFIAFTFPEFRNSEAWRTEAISRFNKEITNQVYPDGHQRELAMGYHMGCIGWFTRTYDLAKMNGLTDVFPASYISTVEKMCEVPMKLGLPDGSSTQFGDSWKGSPGGLWRNMKEWAKLYNRSDFLYLSSEGKEGTVPSATAYALDKSGLYSMRSGWNKDAICLVLKCGPNGGGHSQPDNGTFELYAGGRGLMPDAGCYIYSGDPENRAWFRQTKVHQTITLNGANTAYAPKLLLWKPGEECDILVVENAGYKNLTHRRAVLFVDKKYFIIVDEATGTGTGDVNLHFQLGPGKAVFDKDNYSVRSDFADGWNVLVKTMKQSGLTLNEEEGQISFIYTKKEPRPAFSFRIQKKYPAKGVRYITVVAPYSGKKPEIKATLSGNTAIGSTNIELIIEVNGRKRKIGYNLE
jgi:heparan-sulfate lyase